MVAPADWYDVKLLDTVDLTVSPVEQAAQVSAALPTLRAELNTAAEWVSAALAPVPAWHPADDTWDDEIWFNRAYNESGYGERAAAVQAAQAELSALEQTDDPGRRVAGYVLTRTHGYLKQKGFESAKARGRSTPQVLPNLSLAELIWQARNQDQHYLDSKDLSQPVQDAFNRLAQFSPGVFALASGPSTAHELNALLKQRSWAPEVLVFLGWTSSAAAVAGIESVA